ncbi:MAG: Fic family protein [Ruminococcus sp.]|nr:Fic family protein [Ruminococcus sp.]
MSRKTLKILFHMGAKEYKEEYERRFNDEDTIHLPIKIGNDQAFICQTSDIYKRIISIERLDKKVRQFMNKLPGVAIKQFTNECLIEEIIKTNKIEGVHSTRKEIGEIVRDLSSQNKQNRFVGIVSKYESLMMNQEISFKTCQDIRNVYDDIFFEEIKSTNPEDLPDGQIFRKSGVEVLSPTQKVIHKGLMPESKIIEAFERGLEVLNNEDIDIFIRISFFHYLFGYIHPFYDGNGRTSRFISSYLLSRYLTSLIGFRLSYTIKEKSTKYYEAFEVCNSPHNKGELTPFVEMFLSIIEESMNQLCLTLEEKNIQLKHYHNFICNLPNAEQKDVKTLYYILVQAALFSNLGIDRETLFKHMKCTENTLRKKLKMIPESLLIENRQANKRKFYLLNLEEVDKMFEEKCIDK